MNIEDFSEIERMAKESEKALDKKLEDIYRRLVIAETAVKRAQATADSAARVAAKAMG
jgi:hypothetical protein